MVEQIYKTPGRIHFFSDGSVKSLQEILLILKDPKLSTDISKTQIQDWMQKAQAVDKQIGIKRNMIPILPISILAHEDSQNCFDLAKAIAETAQLDFLPENYDQACWYLTLKYYRQALGIAIAQKLYPRCLYNPFHPLDILLNPESKYFESILDSLELDKKYRQEIADSLKFKPNCIERLLDSAEAEDKEIEKLLFSLQITPECRQQFLESVDKFDRRGLFCRHLPYKSVRNLIRNTEINLARYRLIEAGFELLKTKVESGNSNERKQFNEMLRQVKQGKIKTIIATRWDRLTRNETLYLQLKEILRDCDITLRLLDQGEVDLNTASGELSADMQAIFAVHERRMIRERVKKGNEYRRKRKAACGRAPWGYVNQDEKYVLDTKPIVCALEDRPDNYPELYEEPDDSPNLPGVSKAQIAREAVDYFLQVRRPRQVLKYLFEKYGARRKSYTNLALTEELLFWNAGQHFADWMKNPVLRGHTAYLKYEGRRLKPVDQWQIHQNTHPNQVLITESELIEIKDFLKSNTRKVGTPGSKFYLTGLVFCHECGHKCVLKRGPKYSYYGCRHSGTGCDNSKNVRLEKLDTTIIAKFFEKARAIESQPEIEQVLFESPELIAHKENLASVEKMLEKNPNDILKRTKHELIQQIEKLSSSSEQENFANATAKEILAYPHAKHLGFWYVLSLDEREIVYEKLIKRIDILDGEIVEIELNV